MPSGIVKWFSEKKGYGFIFREGEEDVSVHYASFQSNDGEILVEGDEVEFEIVNGSQGPLAQHVVKL
jgi:CspA family cold shock protein